MDANLAHPGLLGPLEKRLRKGIFSGRGFKEIFYWEMAVRFNFENPPFPLLRRRREISLASWKTWNGKNPLFPP